MALPFAAIPANNLEPFFFVEFDNSNSGVAGGQPQLDLIVGQTISAVPAVPVYVPSAAFAAGLFGAGSQLARMTAAVYAADPEAELWALPLADAASSAAATGTYVFSGTATANGTIFAMIGACEVQVGVMVGMTAAQLATAVAAAITAYRDSNNMALPISAAASSGTVTLTALNKGAVGNGIYLGLNYYGSANQEATPAGIAVAITAMSGGATDPDLGPVAAALGSIPYDFIALAGYAEATQLNEIQTMLSFTGGRWSYSQQLFGHCWTAFPSSDNSGSDLLTFGATRNDPHVSVIGYEPRPSTPFEVAAGYMAAFAAASKADPGRPEQTLPIPGVLAAPSNGQFAYATRNSLLSTGIALMRDNPNGTVTIDQSVTTYQTNAWGQTDRSYLYATTLFEIMYYVRDQKANLTQKFPRSKLAQDGLNFGQQGNFGTDTPAIVTPNVAKAELVAEYTRMCPGGDLPTIMQDPASYAAGLQVQINGSNPNRLDILDDPILVGGLRMIAVINQFQLIDNPSTAASALA